MITAIAHVCLLCDDLEATAAFYTDGLGLREAFSFRDTDHKRHGVYLYVGGRSFLELFQRGDAHPPAGFGGHICLEVEHIEETVRSLRERGITVSDPQMGMDQSLQAWLADPDGHNIELHQYTGESWQRPILEG
jgi:catechol 2,3-dioxygenase-like lactoylglutathione lyase family enzyme